MRHLRVLSRRQEQWYGLRVGASMVWRGDGVAERASLENWRPRKGSASSNLAPSATDESDLVSSVSHPSPPSLIRFQSNKRSRLPH
jgi:hypothetical protein